MSDDSTEQPEPIARLAGAAHSTSSFGIFLMVVGVLGAFGLSLYTDDVGDRPYVGEAISLGVSSLAIGMALWLLGVWAAAWVWRAEGDA
jgi:hypothetical protein